MTSRKSAVQEDEDFVDTLRTFVGLPPIPPEPPSYSMTWLLHVLAGGPMKLGHIAVRMKRRDDQVCRDLGKLAQRGLVARVPKKRGLWRLTKRGLAQATEHVL